MIQDRRNAPRYEIALSIRVGDITGVTRNMSTEGILFVSERCFESGQRIHLYVDVVLKHAASTITLVGEGLVVHSEREPEGWVTGVALSRLTVAADAAVPIPVHPSRPNVEIN